MVLLWRSPASHWAAWEPAPAAHLLECGGSAVLCRATRGRASPDIIPVTHIANFLEKVSTTSALFRQVDCNCPFKDLPLETIGNPTQVQG